MSEKARFFIVVPYGGTSQVAERVVIDCGGTLYFKNGEDVCARYDPRDWVSIRREGIVPETRSG